MSGEIVDTTRSFALGLIGQGIEGSLTPAMHEAEGLAQGLNLTYRRIELNDIGVERLPEVIDWARHFGLQGCNITHPVKQEVLPLLDHLSPLAARIGAVNTVIFETDGTLTGHNTDALGFVRALSTRLPRAQGSRVVQIGAGGAGSAIAHAMLDWGVKHLTVIDVDATRAATLAEKLVENYGDQRAACSTDVAGALDQADGLVNATPIGMAAHPGTPVDTDLLRPEMWVADVIYSPLNTDLIAIAAARGCATMNGSGMAVHQAVEAFQLFTGRPADVERMHETFRVQLGQRGY